MNCTTNMIPLTITTTSSYAQSLIGYQQVANIHSIYQKTVNLLINQQLFSLQAIGSALSPISLITNLTTVELQQFPLLPMERYSFQFQYQCVMDLTLNPPTNLSQNTLFFYETCAKQILTTSNTQGLCQLLKPLPLDFLWSAFQHWLAKSEHHYLQQNWKESADSLAKLVGLGIGLTPSGDDFLCGFLAMFQFAGKNNHNFYQQLENNIHQNFNRTHPISRRFIECALNHQFSATLLHFFALSPQQAVDFPQLIAKFEAIGHSSGMDTLFGVYFACKLLRSMFD